MNICTIILVLLHDYIYGWPVLGFYPPALVGAGDRSPNRRHLVVSVTHTHSHLHTHDTLARPSFRALYHPSKILVLSQIGVSESSTWLHPWMAGLVSWVGLLWIEQTFATGRLWLTLRVVVWVSSMSGSGVFKSPIQVHQLQTNPDQIVCNTPLHYGVICMFVVGGFKEVCLACWYKWVAAIALRMHPQTSWLC